MLIPEFHIVCQLSVDLQQARVAEILAWEGFCERQISSKPIDCGLVLLLKIRIFGYFISLRTIVERLCIWKFRECKILYTLNRPNQLQKML